MDFDERELQEEKYTEAYSEEKLFDKIKKFAKKAGLKVIYLVLLLYYTLQQPETPMKAKSVIVGALGYFIFPMDLIPDFIPVAGYSDDFTALMAAIVMIAFYINDETKRKARERLGVWFGSYDESDLNKIDEKIIAQEESEE